MIRRKILYECKESVCMGLYDNILLPEDFELPNFPQNPRYKENDKDRLWQTKDLLCGQDRYRLRKIDTEGSGTHQLERRVPPIQKMTKEGNKITESELQWWNTVRPTEEIEITEIIHNTIYTYELSINNGVLRDVELIDVYRV